ncbi:hypothetical protein H4R35_004708 [Dimargaris xerosporica]|nr:hypothetical protein H4R35_004708 [Dimargaris xerosporica]
MESYSSSPPSLPSSPDHPHLPAYLAPMQEIPSLSIGSAPEFCGRPAIPGTPQQPIPSAVQLQSPSPNLGSWCSDGTNRAQQTPTQVMVRGSSFYPTPVSADNIGLLRKANSYQEPTSGTPPSALMGEPTPTALHRFTSQFSPHDPFGQRHSWPTLTRSHSSRLDQDIPVKQHPASMSHSLFPPTPTPSHASLPEAATPSPRLRRGSSGLMGEHPAFVLVSPDSCTSMEVDSQASPGANHLASQGSLTRTLSHHPCRNLFATHRSSLKRKLFFDDDALQNKSRISGGEKSRASQEAIQAIREIVDSGTNNQINLSDMDLIEVPDEVCELRHLVSVSANGTLRSDISLYLDHNRIPRLPQQLFQLDNLTVLILSNNCLSTIPPQVGQLTHLRELSVGSNMLRFLPMELARLPSLTIFNAHPNPLLPPTPTAAPMYDFLPLLATDATPWLCSSAPSAINHTTSNPFVHPFTPPTTGLREQLIYVHGFPKLTDLCARVVAQVDPLYLTNRRQPNGIRPLQSPEGSGAATISRQNSDLCRRAFLPGGLKDLVHVAETNRCSVCASLMAIPYLEEVVWGKVCQHADIPLLFRVCSAACRYTDRWTQALQAM